MKTSLSLRAAVPCVILSLAFTISTAAADESVPSSDDLASLPTESAPALRRGQLPGIIPGTANLSGENYNSFITNWLFFGTPLEVGGFESAPASKASTTGSLRSSSVSSSIQSKPSLVLRRGQVSGSVAAKIAVVSVSEPSVAASLQLQSSPGLRRTQLPGTIVSKPGPVSPVHGNP